MDEALIIFIYRPYLNNSNVPFKIWKHAWFNSIISNEGKEKNNVESYLSPSIHGWCSWVLERERKRVYVLSVMCELEEEDFIEPRHTRWGSHIINTDKWIESSRTIPGLSSTRTENLTLDFNSSNHVIKLNNICNSRSNSSSTHEKLDYNSWKIR